MDEFRPLRSRTFWLGLLAVSALAWCWLDSTEYRMAEALPLSPVLYSISSSFSAVHLATIETKAGVPARAACPGGFTREILSSSSSLEQPRFFPMPRYESAETSRTKGRQLTIPYWVMILLGVSGSGAVLEWKRRRVSDDAGAVRSLRN